METMETVIPSHKNLSKKRWIAALTSHPLINYLVYHKKLQGFCLSSFEAQLIREKSEAGLQIQGVQYNKGEKSLYVYIYIVKILTKRHGSAGVDVNMNSKNEDSVESKEDKSMNHDRFAISLQASKLQIPVISWQLK